MSLTYMDVYDKQEERETERKRGKQRVPLDVVVSFFLFLSTGVKESLYFFLLIVLFVVVDAVTSLASFIALRENS